MTRLGRELARLLPVAVVLLFLAWWIPAYFSSYWLRTFTAAVVYSLAALGVGLLYGRLGLVSLANFALLGVGAWVSLRLSLHDPHLPVAANIVVGGVVAAALGTVIGLPALRLRGLYLALVTLMSAGAFFVVINAIGFPEGGSGFTGRGGSGAIRNAPRPSFAETDSAYFRFALVVAVLGFALVLVHLRTSPGRAWAMIRRSEAAAHSAGVNVTMYKTWAFTLAGFLAGVAGGLYAANIGRPGTGDFGAASSMLLFGITVSAGVVPSARGGARRPARPRAPGAVQPAWDQRRDRQHDLRVPADVLAHRGARGCGRPAHRVGALDPGEARAADATDRFRRRADRADRVGRRPTDAAEVRS